MSHILRLNTYKTFTIMKNIPIKKTTNQAVQLSYPTIMLGLDLSTMDDTLLKYARYLVDIFDTKAAYFLHVERDFNFPKEVVVNYENLFTPLRSVDEELKTAVAQSVQKYFDDAIGLDMATKVVEGKTLEQLIHWAEIKAADLLILGKKQINNGSSLVSKQVARKAESDVLFVTENAPTDIESILVPIDFSDNSLRALQKALALAKKIPNVDIIALHVFDVPTINHYYINASYAKFVKMMQENIEQTYETFLKRNNINLRTIKSRFVENIYNSPAKHIKEYAQRNGVDLIVIGSKGHSNLESFWFGSVTEKLVTYCNDTPILISR